jgi:hypothetical protein
MEPVKGVGRQFFRLAGVTDKANQRLYEPGIMAGKQIFENTVQTMFRNAERPGEAEKDLFTLLHIDSTSRLGKT